MTGFSQRFGGAAVVTGASSGIGEAFAKALAARGMDVVLVARRSERLEALARSLESQHSVRTLCVSLDLSVADAAERLSKAVHDAGWSVGLLVNNAGFGLHGPFETHSAERLTEMVDVNCRAPVALTRAFVPQMVSRAKGGVIFVASTGAYQPAPYLATYAASKAFGLYLGEALWAEMQSKGVSVLAVSPGFTPTGFQEVAGTTDQGAALGVATPEAVVETALEALGDKPSVVHGVRNAAVAAVTQMLPRQWVVAAGARVLGRAQHSTTARSEASSPAGSDNRFVRSMVRMLVTFASVTFIDVVVGSLLAGHLRFWFPAWLDTQWATRANPWVTYSQSYLAGVFFIPLLASELAREFAPQAGRWLRTAIWLVTWPTLGFIMWWKGGLMREHHKELEGLAWLALTAIIWTLLRVGEGLPQRVAKATPMSLVRGITAGTATFFLVMSAVDPLLQLGVQGLPWSSGLMVEMGFFIPAGLGLLWLNRRLAARERLPHMEQQPAGALSR